MSSTGHTSIITHSNFQLIIDALADYADQTGVDLSQNPIVDKLQQSNTPDAILHLLQEREESFKEYRDGNRTLISCLSPAICVLHAFSGALGETVPFSPAKAVFVGIDVLLTASGVSSSYDALVELFELLSNFLKRLNVYTNVPLTPLMTDILVKIMVELLLLLALATKQIRQGRFKKFAKELLGESEVEAALQRLDRLTQDEARMTVAQTLGVVHGLVSNTRMVMEDGKASGDSIRQTLTALQQIVNEVNKIKRDQFQRDVRLWLSPSDPSTNHHLVREGYHKGTAKWFFGSRISTDWRSIRPLLWIHGKPGCGKSTFLSAIIQDIEDLRAAGLATIAYYYFDFRDIKKQDCYGLLSSLLSQLSLESDSCYEVLSQLYSDHASGATKPDSIALIKCIKNMLGLPRQGPVYIIIDALDECPNTYGMPSAREQVLDLIDGLVNQNLTNVHLCVTSRPEIGIRKALDPLKPLEISLHDEEGHKNDIIEYVRSVIYSDRKMQSWKDEDKKLVIDTLSNKAGGMFKWIVCQIDRLRRCFPASIRSVLNNLPKNLDEAYSRALLGIDKEKQEYAQRLFRCLTASIRPLHVEELAEVLAVRFDEVAPPTFNADWRPLDASEAVLSACSSLISIVNVAGSQIVQFSHFSVKEFLTSERLANAEKPLSSYHILPEPAHETLACACLSILLQLDDKVDKNTISHLPLAPYAAQYWVDHSRFTDVSSYVDKGIEHLFDPTKPHFVAWVWLYDVDRHWLEPMSGPCPTNPPAEPLYYSSLCGFRGLVEHFINARPQDINARGGYYDTPLHAASAKGHLEIIKLLLGGNADPNLFDDDGQSPLHSASRNGHVEVMKVLVDHGADINREDDDGWTPLHFASFNGRLESAQFLIQCGAVVDTCNSEQATPLDKAVASGNLELVRLLHNCGAGVNTVDIYNWTPLHTAANLGHHDIAELLLEFDASIDAQTKAQDTPLALACRRGGLEVSHLLLDRGADVGSRDKHGRNPLHSASQYGRLDVARLLLDRGADVNAHDFNQLTPLHHASAIGNLDMAKLLIKHGANVDSRNRKLETPLATASWHGHLDISRFLIEHGADVFSRDDEGQTPFHSASEGGHLHVVKFLHERGIEVDIRNGNGQSSLDLASSSGMLDVVRFLVEKGADTLIRDNSGWNPLHIAAQNGHADVVRLLIDSGTAVDVRNGNKRTPLTLASRKGQAEISLLLIERGADMNARDSQGWAPIHLASRFGHVNMARLLLDRDVDPNSRSDDLWTPLHIASTKGHHSVAQLLVQRGATVDVFNRSGQTPLSRAADHGELELARFLIDHGASPHTTDRVGWTPLHSASRRGHVRVVQLLLERDADIDVLNNADKTAAELASENNQVEVANVIAEYKTKAAVRERIHSTASDTTQHSTATYGQDEKTRSLHAASNEGNLDKVVSLLDHGANVNSTNMTCNTPLHLAAWNGNIEIVRLLLERGAEVDPRDRHGRTPLHSASSRGYVGLSRVLIDHGANVNARKNNSWTPIHASVHDGHLELTQLLLERGADIHVLNDEGLTPYQLSLQMPYPKVADLLREHSSRRA